MSSARPAADQGLFLTHFTRGKDLFDQRRFEDAERELEEAYLLKPRDPQVLNLLGIVYFKQEKLNKAEEVYRKLVAESPEAHTLYYNLGLIYFKLNRLTEAEPAFLKALELVDDNPKIHFYLGTIYERLHRFQDAIYQYRQAGASLMVRRVEDRIAVPAVTPTLRKKKKTDDTAEFKAQEVHAALARKSETLGSAAKTVEPVSPKLLAETAPREPAPENTAPVPRSALPETPPSPEEDPGRTTQPLRAVEPFRLRGKGLMEVEFSGKLFVKPGTICSYGGNLTFWVKDAREGGTPPLAIVTGTGRILLADRDREITFFRVKDEAIHVEPGHLLAAQDTVAPRYFKLGTGDLCVEFASLEGDGMVALSIATQPLTLAVTPDLPVSVPAAGIISWTGLLTPRVVDDRRVYEVIAARDGVAGPLVRLEGTGQVMVEQTVL